MLQQAEGFERSSSSEHARCGSWDASARKPITSMNMKTRVARMSHDLRTPLAAILANAEFLTKSNLSKRERNEFYEDIRSSIDRMIDLVSDLLDCSRGSEVLRPAMGNIVETTDSVVKMISVRPAFRNITITHHHQGAAVGWYNARLLERAMSNVVLNACEAVLPGSGRVVIATIGGPYCLRIEVWDNGPGIADEMRDSVFQPFFTHGKSDGTGLGLAIAKRIVEDLGGELLLEAGEKPGTLFKISIPFGVPEGGTGS